MFAVTAYVVTADSIPTESWSKVCASPSVPVAPEIVAVNELRSPVMGITPSNSTSIVLTSVAVRSAESVAVNVIVCEQGMLVSISVTAVPSRVAVTDGVRAPSMLLCATT